MYSKTKNPNFHQKVNVLIDFSDVNIRQKSAENLQISAIISDIFFSKKG